ncbi:MAG TPA: YbdK family carboxylate-amine ligase [Longimicrobiales bacterium]|nr:YbdK family carboxylate-amine ligase [Longimicrobiales bacterium]
MSAFTVGVEEEYQLVEPATGELRSLGRAVLQVDWSGEIRREMQDSTIEIGTRVCSTSGDVGAELSRLRTQADAAAAAEDLRIVAAGLHPFSDWRGQAMSPGSRYRDMAEMYGRIARDEHNYGMHIHVAVDGDRMQLLNVLRMYIPHLVALCCSSPFHEGEDTGYDSFRTVLWRRWPGAGPPPRLESDAAWRAHVDTLLHAGVLPDERSLYWMIRPHPEYPTVEFRMCDVCPRMEDAVAIAGLARAMVAAAAAGRLARITSGSAALDAMLADDCWRTARYGLSARLMSAAPENGGATVHDSIQRLLDAVQPIAAEIGEDGVAEGVESILRRGNAASRMRAVARDAGGMRGLVEWLVAETMLSAGLDRRREQREQRRSRELQERT